MKYTIELTIYDVTFTDSRGRELYVEGRINASYQKNFFIKSVHLVQDDTTNQTNDFCLEEVETAFLKEYKNVIHEYLTN